MEVISFEDAIKIAEKDEVSVLLGNGFSRACFDEIFNYDSLYISSDIERDLPEVAKVFEANNSRDFEKIIRLLNSAATIAFVYEGEESAFGMSAKKDADKLRSLLAETISENHPDYPSDINRISYESCKKFLQPFNNYFSLNYDLLLYWTIIKNEYSPRLYPNDGFRRDQDSGKLVWNVSTADDQNTFYLHGALHLFDTGAKLQKIEWGGFGARLKEQILESLDNNEYPLIVAEGTTTEKQTKIFHNKYLSYCYDKFEELSDNLVVYGFSFDENDEHIVSAIERSYVANIFVGLYGDYESPNNRKIIERINQAVDNRARMRNRVSLIPRFYDAKSVNIWAK